MRALHVCLFLTVGMIAVSLHAQSLPTEMVQPMGLTLKDYKPFFTAVLPPLTEEQLAELRYEDTHPKTGADGYSFKPCRLAIGRNLDKPIVVNKDTVPTSAWRKCDNGWKILSVEITSTGSHGIFVRVNSLSTPDRAKLIFFSPETPSHVQEIVAQRTPKGNTDYSVGPIGGDTVIIECQVPPNADENTVTFTVQTVLHFYKNFYK